MIKKMVLGVLLLGLLSILAFPYLGPRKVHGADPDLVDDGTLHFKLIQMSGSGAIHCASTPTGVCEIAYGTIAQAVPTYSTVEKGSGRTVQTYGDDIRFCVGSKRDFKWPGCLGTSPRSRFASSLPADASTGLDDHAHIENLIAGNATELFMNARNRDNESDAYHAKQIDELDELLNRFNQLDQRYLDGQWKMAGMFDTLGYNMRGALPQSQKTIERWKKVRPQSVAVAITEAVYWFEYAWNVRGNGYAYTVTSEGWALYRDSIQKALDVMQESRAFAGHNWVWNELYLDLAAHVGWKEAALLALLKQASDTNPAYRNFYRRALVYYTPRWGGNYSRLDAFVNEIAAQTKSVEGDGMYALLYAEALKYMDDPGTVFVETKANWPRMKKSFDELSQRYPRGAVVANKYALFACLAKDKETYVRLRPQLEKALMPNSWPSNHPVEVCDRRFQLPG